MGRRPGWLRPAQAAAFLGLHRETLNRYVRDDLLRCYYTPGGHRRFARTDLERIHGKVYGGAGALEDASEEAQRAAATAREDCIRLAKRAVLDFAVEVGASEDPLGRQALAPHGRDVLVPGRQAVGGDSYTLASLQGIQQASECCRTAACCRTGNGANTKMCDRAGNELSIRVA